MQFSIYSQNRPGNSLKKFSPVLSLYFYTLGTVLLGFSVYLFTLTLGSSNPITSWSGESLFWSLILFFLSLFILFLPIEFFNKTDLNNTDFSDLVVNIVFVILISLMGLIFSQFLNQESRLFDEVRALFRSVSFSGFITIPFALFVFHNFLNKYKKISDYTFHLLLTIWIVSVQFFL